MAAGRWIIKKLCRQYNCEAEATSDLATFFESNYKDFLELNTELCVEAETAVNYKLAPYLKLRHP